MRIGQNISIFIATKLPEKLLFAMGVWETIGFAWKETSHATFSGGNVKKYVAILWDKRLKKLLCHSLKNICFLGFSFFMFKSYVCKSTEHSRSKSVWRKSPILMPFGFSSQKNNENILVFTKRTHQNLIPQIFWNQIA